jgi:serine/threonine-protein kinase
MGGMGEVYRARDERLGRRVALKVVRADREDHTGVAPDDRLIGEARAAAALRHPNVVEIFDAGFDAGRTYVAMEFIEGKPLREYVGDAMVPLATRKRWVLQIGAALAAAHRAGLIHRDVKPENVLVDSEGAARVLDFGLAKRVAHDSNAPTADGAPETIAGRVVGTISYMAPEQLAGGPPDPKWDQFAWGLVAYELFTGLHPRLTVPMPGPTAHLGQTPKMANEVAPEVPFSDAATILTATAIDPARRFQSMDAAVAALRAESTSAGHAPATRVEAARAAVPARPAAPARRWPIVLAVVLATGVGVAVGRETQRDASSQAMPVQSTTPAPPPASIAAPPPTVAQVVIAHSIASVAPSAPQRALPADYGRRCSCQNLHTLCPLGATLRERQCECHDEKEDVLASNDAGTLTFYGAALADGRACKGLNESGVMTSGHLENCSYTCDSNAFAGIHRTACRGLDPYTGKPSEGLLYCY